MFSKEVWIVVGIVTFLIICGYFISRPHERTVLFDRCGENVKAVRIWSGQWLTYGVPTGYRYCIESSTCNYPDRSNCEWERVSCSREREVIQKECNVYKNK